jgi:DNA replication protein DnaC
LNTEKSNPTTQNGSSPITVTFSDRCSTCGFEPGQPGFVRFDVLPDHPNYGRIEPCPTCHAAAMANRKRFTGELEGDLKNCSFENFYDQYNKAALEAARGFARQPVGMLIFWGPNGRGKTHLLAAIHNHLRGYGVPAKFFSFPDWTSELRSRIGDEEQQSPEEFYQYVSQFPVVMVDDIDYADIRRWTREQVYRLLNRRYNNHNEVGTVLAMESSLKDNEDMRWLFSRISDERMTMVEMVGPDNRKQFNLIRRLSKIKQVFEK